jgi:hypothetical protein
MDVFFSGAWRTPKRAELVISGVWRTITRGEAVLGGNWHTIASFVPPLSLTVNPSAASGVRRTKTPSSGVVATNSVVATPKGGSGPYSYAWTIVSGSANITSPSMASTAFTATLPPESDQSAIARVSCTDSLGNVAYMQISVFFSNLSLQ